MKKLFWTMLFAATIVAFAGVTTACSGGDDEIEEPTKPDVPEEPENPTPEEPETPTTTITGWPAEYGGVMLQGFYWDGYDDAQWTVLEAQADELSQYFKLVWLPQSGNCGGKSMGYDDLYWFPGGTNYTSSFGTEAQLRSLIQTFSTMASTFGAKVCVEGIETSGMRDILQQFNIQSFQGYYYGKPLELREFLVYQPYADNSGKS